MLVLILCFTLMFSILMVYFTEQLIMKLFLKERCKQQKNKDLINGTIHNRKCT